MIEKIAIIGMGNVGSYLSRAFEDKGLAVDCFSRKANGSSIKALQSYDGNFDLSLICVPDDKIADLSEELPAGPGIVAHTSGTMPLDSIAIKHARPAIFYPLMSLKAHYEIPLAEIPFCLESLHLEDWQRLKAWADKISLNSRYLNSEDRAKLHLAAVISHNFSNYLYHWAWATLAERDLDFSLLQPLLAQQISRLSNEDPALRQTGPAVRGDRQTIAKHLEQIESLELKSLYQNLSKLIAAENEKEL